MNASSVNHETKFTTLHFIYFLGIFLRWSVSEGLEKKWNLLPTNWRQSILVPESVLWHGDRRRRMDGIFKHTFCLCFFFNSIYSRHPSFFFFPTLGHATTWRLWQTQRELQSRMDWLQIRVRRSKSRSLARKRKHSLVDQQWRLRAQGRVSRFWRQYQVKER